MVSWILNIALMAAIFRDTDTSFIR
jgi:hypothetical protein